MVESKQFELSSVGYKSRNFFHISIFHTFKVPWNNELFSVLKTQLKSVFFVQRFIVLILFFLREKSNNATAKKLSSPVNINESTVNGDHNKGCFFAEGIDFLLRGLFCCEAVDVKREP